MSVMMKGFIMKNVIKDGSVRHKEGFMGEYDGHEANIVEVRNGKTRYAKLDNDDIMKMIGVRSNENDLEDRLKEMLSDDTGHGSHTRHHRSHRRHHRSHRRSHKRKRRSHPRSHATHKKHKRKHTKHKRKHTKHKRKHKRNHKRKHTKHKRKHKRSIRA